MSAPLVSVIIPAYNYARFLPAAIDSALQQRFANREVIVVDDGSTDDTAKVAENYGGRVRCIHQQNAGLPAARNTGVRMARGEFVGFLDADDEWLPELLEEAMAAFARLPPEFGIVAFRHSYINEAGEPLALKDLRPEIDEEVPCRDLVMATRFSPSAVVARRAALVEAGYFDPSLRSAEDRDMWMRAASQYRVLLCRQRRARVRRHGTNMSRNADRMKENTRRVLAKAWEARLVPRGQAAFWLQAYSFHAFQTAWMYHSEHRRGAAVRDMLKSVVLWPWFARPRKINEPCLFRARALARFLFRQSL